MQQLSVRKEFVNSTALDGLITANNMHLAFPLCGGKNEVPRRMCAPTANDMHACRDWSVLQDQKMRVTCYNTHQNGAFRFVEISTCVREY